MNHDQLRALGKKYEDSDSGVTLWMHRSDNFGAKSLFLDVAQQLPVSIQNASYLNVFMVAHCYVLSWEGDKDNPLIQYLEQRDPLDIIGGLNTFSILCDDKTTILLSNAFTSTRHITNEMVEDDEAKKKNTLDDGNEKQKSKK